MMSNGAGEVLRSDAAGDSRGVAGHRAKAHARREGAPAGYRTARPAATCPGSGAAFAGFLRLSLWLSRSRRRRSRTLSRHGWERTWRSACAPTRSSGGLLGKDVGEAEGAQAGNGERVLSAGLLVLGPQGCIRDEPAGSLDEVDEALQTREVRDERQVFG
jgi:hypothetical protein